MSPCRHYRPFVLASDHPVAWMHHVSKVQYDYLINIKTCGNCISMVYYVAMRVGRVYPHEHDGL